MLLLLAAGPSRAAAPNRAPVPPATVPHPGAAPRPAAPPPAPAVETPFSQVFARLAARLEGVVVNIST
ncbi:MAG: hypothetical protein ACREE4_22385, partial [Stellaceae bacterium]